MVAIGGNLWNKSFKHANSGEIFCEDVGYVVLRWDPLQNDRMIIQQLSNKQVANVQMLCSMWSQNWLSNVFHREIVDM